MPLVWHSSTYNLWLMAPLAPEINFATFFHIGMSPFLFRSYGHSTLC
jgi:hypothetical protein